MFIKIPVTSYLSGTKSKTNFAAILHNPIIHFNGFHSIGIYYLKDISNNKLTSLINCITL